LQEALETEGVAANCHGVLEALFNGQTGVRI